MPLQACRVAALLFQRLGAPLDATPPSREELALVGRLVTLLTLAEQDQLTVEEEDELVEDEDDDYEDGDYDSYDGYKPPPGVGMIRIGDVYKTRAQVLYISYSF